MRHHLLRKKTIGYSYTHSPLKSSLSAVDLVLMGIGAIIGAGVFVLTGLAAATKAGPAVTVSYMIAGMASMFAALAYAELAASIGGAGGAYNYAYTGFGEFIAWMVGWDLLLEYTMSVSTVAISWAGYTNNLFQSLSIHLPIAITKNPFEGGVINLLAIFIIFFLSILLCMGVKQSARFNAVIVFIKLLTITAFVAIAAVNVDTNNWNSFLPFGWAGVMHGAALVFFAYIGFDALSTAVEEATHPQRDIPLGIIISLTICTLIYIAVSALLTSIVHYSTLNVTSPVADALLRLNYRIMSGLIVAGALAGLTTVMLVMFYGLTRICLAIARDGLLPNIIAKTHPKTYTPVRIIIIAAIINACIAGFSPLDRAAELVNIGTLFAFTLVCMGVMALRYTHPTLLRPFKLPFNPLFPSLGVIFCVYLMMNLPFMTWLRFFVWMGIGVIIYFLYGQKYSLLNTNK